MQLRNRAAVTVRRFEQSGFAAGTLCSLCSSAASHQAPCIINTCGKRELNRGDRKTPTAHSSTAPQLLASLAATKLRARYSGRGVFTNITNQRFVMFGTVQTGSFAERAAKSSVNILETGGRFACSGRWRCDWFHCRTVCSIVKTILDSSSSSSH